MIRQIKCCQTQDPDLMIALLKILQHQPLGESKVLRSRLPQIMNELTGEVKFKWEEECELETSTESNELETSTESILFNLKPMNMQSDLVFEIEESETEWKRKWDINPEMNRYMINITDHEYKTYVQGNNFNERVSILKKLSLKHPWMIKQGPFNLPIGCIKGDGLHTYCKNGGKPDTFRSWTTFVHTDDTPCQLWGVQPLTYPAGETKLDDIYTSMVSSTRIGACGGRAKTELHGPASGLIDRELNYPCDRGMCWIQCSCKECSGENVFICKVHNLNMKNAGYKAPKLLDISANHVAANINCYPCKGQCREHIIGLRRLFNPITDSFTISLSGFQFDLDKPTPGTKNISPPAFIERYPGIPRDCNHCQEDLLDHEVYHKVIHLSCKFCKKNSKLLYDTCSRKQFVECHKLEVHIESTTCKFCYKDFSGEKSRKQHEKKFHQRKVTYGCNNCKKGFLSKTSLDYHKTKKCHVSRLFTCRSCQMKFNTYAQYLVHRRAEKSIPEPEGKLQCPFCKVFISRKNMSRHWAISHGISRLNQSFVEEPRYTCSVCKKTFTRKDHLDRHLLCHESIQEPCHVCPTCKEKFTRKDKMDRHISTKHTYKCKQCMCLFGSEEELKLHQGTHLLCNVCNKTFKEKKYLTQHTNTVHGVHEDYKCTKPTCTKTFSRKGNQERHSRICKK